MSVQTRVHRHTESWITWLNNNRPELKMTKLKELLVDYSVTNMAAAAEKLHILEHSSYMQTFKPRRAAQSANSV